MMLLCEENGRPGQEPTRLIIGCDFHVGFEVLAIFDNQIGAMQEKRLSHPAEAIAFYRELQGARRAGAGGHGGGSAVPVVPAFAGRVRTRVG